MHERSLNLVSVSRLIFELEGRVICLTVSISFLFKS